jgi:hypothetical protein
MPLAPRLCLLLLLLLPRRLFQHPLKLMGHCLCLTSETILVALPRVTRLVVMR